jgi:amidase
MRLHLDRRAFLIVAGATLAGARQAMAQAPGAASVPPRAAAYTFRTAREQVAALAARQVSARELVDHAIARIEALDGRINAVVVRDFDRARAAAGDADAALARGERRPLLGLPMTVKESFNVAGLPTTWGFPAAKDWRPAADAVVVARVKAAGAIVLGKTNVPIALADWQSYNEIYGVTNNPWDLARTPGGSSGGSAAALTAGYVALELGSDIGGSLRVPAHFCGVFSLKPSQGLVPSRGHAPPRAEPLARDTDLAVVGPMARSAADLALALDVLAGPDEPQAAAYRLALRPPRHQDLKAYRVLAVDTHPLLPTASSVRTGLDRLAGRLASAGARVERASPLLPDLAAIARTYTLLLLSVLGAGFPPERYRRIEAAVAAIPAEDQSLDTLRGRGVVLSHRDWITADRARGAIARQWAELFRQWDVVLAPVIATPAFPHDHSTDRRARRLQIDGADHIYDDQVVWASLATLTGLPAAVAPIGRSDAGLPIGVQIIGPFLEDRTPVHVAGLIERELGGFVPPPAFPA